MLTINGARCMLWDKELGSIEVGKKADITLLDIMRPEWQPIHNPIANLVYCAHGGCADTVIVDGRILMSGGKVLTLNESDLYAEAQDRRRLADPAHRARGGRRPPFGRCIWIRFQLKGPIWASCPCFYFAERSEGGAHGYYVGLRTDFMFLGLAQSIPCRG